MQKIKLIVNPTSGRGRARAILGPLADALRYRGYATEIHQTRCAGDAYLAAQETGGSTSWLMAIGGDGTINEVVSGNMSNQIPVGLVPTGTANILAREFDLPWRVSGLCRMMEDPQVFWIDAVKTTQPEDPTTAPRYTLAVASAGFDADVVHAFDQRRSGSIRMSQYVGPVISKLFRYRAPSLEVEVDGRIVERDASMVVMGNCRNYGGHFELAYDADPADGLMDVCILKGKNRRDLLRYFAAAVMHRIRHTSDHLYYKARELVVRGPAGKPFQVDGDPGGLLPVRFEIVTHSVPLLTMIPSPA